MTGRSKTQVRDAFRPIGTPRSAGEQATPDDRLVEAMRQIVAAWNRCIPVNKVRVLSQYRYYSLREILHWHTADEVCRAIEFYGRQRWQREHRAWKRFDDWIDIVTQWIEAEAEDREKREQRQPPPKKVREALAGIGDCPPEDSMAADLQAFNALPPTRRYELLAKAKAATTPGLRDHKKVVLMHAITLMKQEAGR